jgi:hypothetical protein
MPPQKLDDAAAAIASPPLATPVKPAATPRFEGLTEDNSVGDFPGTALDASASDFLGMRDAGMPKHTFRDSPGGRGSRALERRRACLPARRHVPPGGAVSQLCADLLQSRHSADTSGPGIVKRTTVNIMMTAPGVHPLPDVRGVELSMQVGGHRWLFSCPPERAYLVD